MSTQTSLLDPTPDPPRAMVEFLSGVAARFAFGEKRTAEQNRQADRVGEDMARRLVDLRSAA